MKVNIVCVILIQNTLKMINCLRVDQRVVAKLIQGIEKLNEDSICLQIHTVKLQCNQTNRLVGKIINTIAIYYPLDFATKYTNSEPEYFEPEEDE